MEAIVYNWVTAGGSNTVEDCAMYLRSLTTAKLATIIHTSWYFPKKISLSQMTTMVEQYRKSWKSL